MRGRMNLAGATRAAVCAGLALAALAIVARAQSPGKTQELQLPSGAAVRVSSGWVQQPIERIPPPPLLAPFAPRLTFAEFLTAQDAQSHSLLLLGVSNNFLLHGDAYSLDAQMHQPAGSGKGMLDYLFYFFFPPPRNCLEQARADYRRALAKSDADDSGHSDKPRDAHISLDCHYLPTLSDFYSAQVSRGMSLRRVSGVESAGAEWGNFYLAPMEQVEANGLTFFVFEAQGQRQLGLEAIRHFNLPDDLQGAQADIFWAVGAPTPFPFVYDAARKNVPLLHVVYAGLGLGPNLRPEFLRLLHSVTIPPPED